MVQTQYCAAVRLVVRSPLGPAAVGSSREEAVFGQAVRWAEEGFDGHIGDERIVGQGHRAADRKLVIEILLLDERQDGLHPAIGPAGHRPVIKRKRLLHIVIVLQRQANLLQVVAALHAAGRLAGRLHGRQQQRDQHADDGDDD